MSIYASQNFSSHHSLPWWFSCYSCLGKKKYVRDLDGRSKASTITLWKPSGLYVWNRNAKQHADSNLSSPAHTPCPALPCICWSCWLMVTPDTEKQPPLVLSTNATFWSHTSNWMSPGLEGLLVTLLWSSNSSLHTFLAQWLLQMRELQFHKKFLVPQNS